jgi:F-type H+-transporting ATPase subunit b
MKTKVMKSLVIFILMLCSVSFVSFSFAEEKAAEHGEQEAHGESLVQTIGKWLNFLALVAILYLFLSRSLRVQDKFKTESEEIQRSIESARQAKEEAEQRLAELEQRMQSVNQEIEQMRTVAAQEAAQEKDRILDSARREAERIVELAHREIESEVRRSRKQLRKRVADLSVAEGKKIIQKEMNDQDHDRLIEDYIKEFGK